MTGRRAVVSASLMGGLGMLLSGMGLLIMAASGPDVGPVERQGKFGTSLVTVDVGMLPSVDGKPYGDKIIETQTLCP